MSTEARPADADRPTLPPAARPGLPAGEVDTPALLLDLAAFERNLDRLQARADAAGVQLRPHAKAHKCPDIARAQIARGAVGVCCQKVSEALPFVQAGIGDIHLSNQVASPAKADLLARLARHARMSVCVDSTRQIDLLAAAVRTHGSALDVLVEIDIGQGRCGVADAAAVLRLLEHLERAARQGAGLHFRGLQAYHGAIQHLRDAAQRHQQAALAAARAARVLSALQHAGVACPVVTGGGTGSVAADLASGLYTEVQPGSYVFMDGDYALNEPGPADQALRFEHSLYLASTVMSTAGGTHVVLDAGLKSLATDSGLPRVCAVGGGATGHRYLAANDEHGIVQPAPGAATLAEGEPLWLVPGHCDPTLNLHDQLVGCRDGRVECIWPIAARGLSR